MVDFDQESNKMFNEAGNNLQLEQHADWMVLHVAFLLEAW
jgi:hypothetical protein